MMVAGFREVDGHVLGRGPEEGVTDSGVIDEKAIESRFQEGTSRHFADQFVKTVVLDDSPRCRCCWLRRGLRSALVGVADGVTDARWLACMLATALLETSERRQ